MTDSKLPGAIQVDVDDLWVYYESIGRRAPADGPAPAFDQGVPRLLDLFDQHAIRATFFVCGRDAPQQQRRLAEILRRGHEIANHSTWHRTGFASLSREEKRADIAAAHWLLAEATGVAPRGFKSPGFSFAADQLEVLASLGYRYDSSLLPTPYAPLLRLTQRLLSGGSVDPSHYGRARYGTAPLHPYTPASDAPQRPARNGAGSAVIEAPVTTLPLARLPMHSTFVLATGRPLFDAGLALATARRVPVNYLLHAADAIDAVDDPALASYRFLTQPWSAKRPLLEHMLAALAGRYRLLPTIEYVDALVGPE